ncbi:MAG: Crp/Fnr family transcriptional regulator [Chloroflexales bacterium]
MSNSELLSQAQIITVLAATPLFAALSPPLLEALAAIAESAHYDPHQVVFLAGAPDANLYIVADGWVKAFKSTPEGREQTLALFGPGEVFNLAVLADVPTLVTVMALEPVTLWRFPRASLYALIAIYPELAQALIRGLTAHVIRLSKLVEDLALRPVDVRLARLLLQREHDDEVVRRHWATQAELAAQLGTVPDVLNRVLRAFVAAQLIVVERKRIRILDHAGLVARAQFP